MPAARKTPSLERLFNPRSVAIVGASPRQDRYTGRIVRYCRAAGYDNLHLVNPRYSEIEGLPCHPSLSALGTAPDVVVCMISPDQVPALYREARESAFFVLIGDMARRDDSRPAQYAEMLALLEAGGPRIVGPQSLGVLSPVNGNSLSISSAQVGGATPAGRIGMISQSGGIISAVIDRARELGIGFSHIASTGDEFDLEAADYLEFMLEDPGTAVIAIHAESLRDPPRFLAAARTARERGKAILLLKPGRSVEAMQAARSHSGRLTGRRDVQQAHLERNGVVLVDDIDDLWLAAELIARHGALRGGIGAASTSGGYTAVVADALKGAGVDLAAMSAATLETLRSTGVHHSPSNPVDAAARGVPGMEPADVETALKTLAADPAVGATLYAETLFLDADPLIDKLIEVSASSGKAHVTAWQAGPTMQATLAKLRRGGVLAVTDLGQAVRALAVAGKYGKLAGGSSEEPPPAAIAGTLGEAGPGPLGEEATAGLLAAHRVPFVTQHLAGGADEAATAAQRIGFPVVLKGVLADCLHKSELGLVKLGLADASAVRQAAEEMRRRIPTISGFVVQAEVKGEEFIVGVNTDEGFGAALMLSRGGIFAETSERVAIEAVPITPAIGDAMIARIDPKGILQGYRGQAPLARARLVELLCAVSALVAANLPRIQEIDLNPVIVTRTDCVAVDSVVILR